MGKQIAFFCAEYGIEGLPIYAGGLGMLAEDFFMEAGDQNLSFNALGLFYHGGISESERDFSSKSDILKQKQFHEVLKREGKPLILDADLKDKIIKIKVWVKDHKSAKLFLLDTNTEENDLEAKNILSKLYDSNPKIRVLQQLILGIGGVKLLRSMGIVPEIYHLNEGHTAFAALALIAEYFHDHPEENSLEKAITQVKDKIVATKHTILPDAGMYVSRTDFYELTQHYFARHRINSDEFFALGAHYDDPENFSATRFLMNVAIRKNAVSMIHALFEKKKHPMGDLLAITNGVHAYTWRSTIWPRQGINTMTDKEIWLAREELKKDLAGFVEKHTNKKIDPNALFVVWARRFAKYKRPDLLFSDIERLKKISNNTERPVYFIISGKAHENDVEGQQMIKKIKDCTLDPEFGGKIIYLPDYSASISKKLVSGADIWLNTPIPGVEACGTSGMKSGINGALQMSTNDGWIGEVDWGNIGFVLSDENTAGHLYKILEEKVVPLFYERQGDNLPEEWIKKMRETIQIVESRFTTKRMVQDYLEKLYFPSSHPVSQV